MANTHLKLDELWEIAGRQYGTVTLREATTFDIVQARQQAEEVREIVRPDNSREVVVVASPMRAARIRSRGRLRPSSFISSSFILLPQ